MTPEVTKVVAITAEQMTAIETECTKVGVDFAEATDGIDTYMFRRIPSINIKKTGDTELTLKMVNVPDTVDTDKAFRLFEASLPQE